MANKKFTNLNWDMVSSGINGNLSQVVQRDLKHIEGNDDPDDCRVSWTDLYRIFQNSRWLVKESKKLADPFKTGDLVAISHVMHDSHRFLRGSLFLVAIERLFHIGHKNAFGVLWEYGNELELVHMICRELDHGEDIRLVA